VKYCDKRLVAVGSESVRIAYPLVHSTLDRDRHTGFLSTNPLTPSTSSLRVALIKQPCTPSFGIHPLAGSINRVRSSLCPYDRSKSASSTAKKQRLERLIVFASKRASNLVGVEMMTSGASLRSDLLVSLLREEGHSLP
jgi:hypothetical protein